MANHLKYVLFKLLNLSFHPYFLINITQTCNQALKLAGPNNIISGLSTEVYKVVLAQGALELPAFKVYNRKSVFVRKVVKIYELKLWCSVTLEPLDVETCYIPVFESPDV